MEHSREVLSSNLDPETAVFIVGVLFILIPRSSVRMTTSSRSAPVAKLIVVQLFKKFPAFYGTITVFTTARHRSLSGAS
jgi:hypothetical protein